MARRGYFAGPSYVKVYAPSWGAATCGVAQFGVFSVVAYIHVNPPPGTPPMPSIDEKLTEIILHIARRSESDPRFGRTKLNKILFYADFMAYGKLGKTITGQTYQKLEWGPAPRRLLPVTDKMRAAGELVWQQRDYYGKPQTRAVALREPRLHDFSGDEVAMVEEIISTLWDQNGTEVSDLSHRTCAWKYAGPNEDIPPESVFVSDRKLTATEKAYAVELV